jgi:cephalosporin hydroxylase
VNDLWSLQEIIYETNPDCIIETGTAHGGAALYYAEISEPKCKVISIDIVHKDHIPLHKKITYICGSSLDKPIIDKVKKLIKGCKRIMVTLDSIHLKDWVMMELDVYSKLVSKGQYLIVDDTNLNGHPVLTSKTAQGPYEAVQKWIKHHPEFKIDRNREKFGFSFNPSGFLLKTGR